MADSESQALETDVPTSNATHENGTIDETASQQLSSELMETIKEAEPNREDVTTTTTNTTAEDVNNEETGPKNASNVIEERASTPNKPAHNTEKEEAAQHADKKPYKGKFPRSDRQWKNNIKSDVTSQPESSDPVEIRKQVAFTIH